MRLQAVVQQRPTLEVEGLEIIGLDMADTFPG